ncbi:hypothetical protein EB241_03965 [Erwinia psidii]|uniref:Uncharacterized protein n=1 Tax=Erwinia psidii TaxID=69224 RepID=A0A3N6TWE5_9GAMM|nr:hypothetical protein EB241_03965 [Erwinia psidii]
MGVFCRRERLRQALVDDDQQKAHFLIRSTGLALEGHNGFFLKIFILGYFALKTNIFSDREGLFHF